MDSYKFVFFACLLALLLSCSGNFEPIPYDSRAGTSSSSYKASSSSSIEQDNSSSSSVPSSSSTEESSSSSSISSSSSSIPSPSSSSITSSSSSSVTVTGRCKDFVYGTEIEHQERLKKQFCDERDGSIYVFVTIGSQTWMAENLNYDTKSPNSMYGPNGPDLGRYYNWSAATDNVCPLGWHLPNDTEWMNLMYYINKNHCPPITRPDAYECIKKDVGRSLKIEEFSGIDSLGFSALQSGFFRSSSFINDPPSGNWWTSTSDFEDSINYAYIFSVERLKSDADIMSASKRNFYNVRCIKD